MYVRDGHVCMKVKAEKRDGNATTYRTRRARIREGADIGAASRTK